MTSEIKVPSLGESVTEATVARWLKQPGEAVAVDDPVVELETDKVTLEVFAPASGKLAEIIAAEGANVPVGAVLGRIAEGDAVEAPLPARGERPAKREGERQRPPEPLKADRLERAGPAARKLIAENAIDAAAIPASGPGGRIEKADVLAF